MTGAGVKTDRHGRRRTWRLRLVDTRDLRLQKLQSVMHHSVWAAPALLFGCADVIGMPSGLQAAYITALCAMGRPIVYPAIGAAAAMLLRFAWGIPAHPELLLTLLGAALMRRMLKGCGNLALMAVTAMLLLPMPIASAIGGTAMELTFAMGAVAVAALSAPVLLRALNAWLSDRPVDCLDARVACGYALGMLLCGGARMMVLGVNVGLLGASLVILLMGLCIGVSAGMLMGLVSGLVFALQGYPVELTLCLTLAGFLAGMTSGMSLRWLTCLAFGAGLMLMTVLSGVWIHGCIPACIIASVAVWVAPSGIMSGIRHHCRRFAPAQTSSADAYASSALTRWERTVAAMAEAVPVPRLDDAPHDAPWWKQHLCGACPDAERCEAMLTKSASARASQVWAQRKAGEDAWLEALEQLRGLGCGRLYCLRLGMEELRRDEQQRQQWVRRASDQRAMLVTHLTALSGAARRYAQCASGETWWDAASLRRMRQRVSETAFPATVLYARRVNGHACAALEMHHPEDVKRLLDDAVCLTSGALETVMRMTRVEGNRIHMQACPPFRVLTGVSGCGVADGMLGDSAWTGYLDDGRFVAALSDGMGQGRHAGEESSATVNLLRLCLDAGYTREQTLMAVNGMMLLETGGERFATADLLTIDLWNAQATLDKLGAASSWLLRGVTLAEITGDALPIGILETVESRQSVMRLRGGDCIALLTDGVEDAFSTKAALEDAIRSALEEPNAQHAAELLLQSAQEEAAGARSDDMTVIVIRLQKSAEVA